MWGILITGVSLELSCVKMKKTHSCNRLPEFADNKWSSKIRTHKFFLINGVQKNSTNVLLGQCHEYSKSVEKVLCTLQIILLQFTFTFRELKEREWGNSWRFVFNMRAPSITLFLRNISLFSMSFFWKILLLCVVSI